jgi:hypothetical protein
MHIDIKTHLFTNLTNAEAAELLKWAEYVVLRGSLPPKDPEWVTDWLQLMEYNENERLIVLTTVLPQHVLLSVSVQAQTRRYAAEADAQGHARKMLPEDLDLASNSITQARVENILDEAMAPQSNPNLPPYERLIHRIQHFALDWFAGWGPPITRQDLAILRYSVKFYNEHQRTWPWGT